jgi:choline monooxygenase
LAEAPAFSPGAFLPTMSLIDFDMERRLEIAETLPSRCYTDERVLALEERRIFHRTWQLVGRSDSIKSTGEYFTARIGEEPIVVVRGQDGDLHGWSNVCRHRAGPVAVGAGQCKNFRCAYHGWTYSHDGKLIGVPDFDGVGNFQKETMGLRPIELAVWEQYIFARIVNAEGPTLDELFEDIPSLTRHCRIQEMKFAERREYVIECNWKVYVDNYLEGYHVPLIHPSLMREIDFQRYRTITRKYSSLQDAPIKSGDDPNRLYQASAEQSQALYFWVFPNLMLNVYPDNLSTNLILPLGNDRTLTIFDWYFHDVESDQSKERIRRTIDLSDEIQQEDIWICEQVQRGLKSVFYDRGRYSVKRENGVHHFHTLWMEAMAAGDDRKRPQMAGD